jgi:hypothetical protein
MAQVAEKPKPKNDEEFTNLRSDKELRQKMAELECENPSDRRSIDLILKQIGFTGAQRTWMNAILARNGGKFFEILNKKKGKTA